MNVTSLVSLTWLLLVLTLSEVTFRANANSSAISKNVSLKVQACGETLNQVLKLVCAGIYRRKRSLSPEYGLTDPNSISNSPSTSLEEGDIETLLALFGEDLPVEDYRPLSYLLKENALYFDDSEPVLPGGPPFWTHARNSPGSPYFTLPRYLRLRRQQKAGVHHECCLNKCSYNTLRSYCGENRHAKGN